MDVDTRVSRPAESFHGRTIFHLPLKEYASSEYFIRLLPERHFKEVIVSAINEHALTMIPSFKRVSIEEYIIWNALFAVMTTARMEDRAAYWHRGDFPYKLSVNFSDYMAMSRFELLIKMQCLPGRMESWKFANCLCIELNTYRFVRDPLYQIRGFMDAFNDNLADALTPGRYLCVDESMSQSLGYGIPNLKQIPRKPRSIGQEYKTVADVTTCCSLFGWTLLGQLSL